MIAGGLTAGSFLICTLVSLVLGVGIGLLHRYKNHASRGFLLTLAILPAIIEIIIMMVNGNLGAGVAVAGAFSLIRFRSAPGSAREITSIFLAMAVGLATGMGYVTAAVMFFIIMAAVILLLLSLHYGEETEMQELRVNIPEQLEYADVFDDLLDRYTSRRELVRVKTTGMGSMYELKYRVCLKQSGTEKAFLDEIRTRNGNLTVSLGRVPDQKDEL